MNPETDIRICDNHYVLPGGKVVCESNFDEDNCTRKNDPAFLCPIGMTQPNKEQWKRTAHDFLHHNGQGPTCNCYRCQPRGITTASALPPSAIALDQAAIDTMK